MTQAVATAPSPTAPTQDGPAFEELYRGSRDELFAYLAGLLRDRSAAEELTAQAFERAWRRRAQLDPARGSARAWLFGIARNAALDELRRRKRAGTLPGDDVLPGADRDAPAASVGLSRAAGSAADPAEIALRRTLLRDAIATLSGRERELIALKFFAGLSNREIATVIGASESNAGTKLHRAILKLRRSCDEAA